MILRILGVYLFVAGLVAIYVGFVEDFPLWPAFVFGMFWPIEIATWLGLVERPPAEAF